MYMISYFKFSYKYFIDFLDKSIFHATVVESRNVPTLVMNGMQI